MVKEIQDCSIKGSSHILRGGGLQILKMHWRLFTIFSTPVATMLTKLGTKHSQVKGILLCMNLTQYLSQKGDDDYSVFLSFNWSVVLILTLAKLVNVSRVGNVTQKATYSLTYSK